MSNELAKKETGMAEFISREKDSFDLQNTCNLSFDIEKSFAVQQITKTDFAIGIARANPASVHTAMANVAAIGLSLNPANAHAYLVPRDKAIRLDISYRGLVKLATDSGVIEWVKAELVYKADDFKYNGPAAMPDHGANPFATPEERGPIVGVYCIAKLTTGDILCDTMSMAEISEVRATSKAKTGPWVNWFGEMTKKTIIKRASKQWPQSNGMNRLATAVQAANEVEGLTDEHMNGGNLPAYTAEQLTEMNEYLNTGNGIGYLAFVSQLDDRTKNDLFNSGEKNKKTALKTALRDLEKAGHAYRKDATEQLTEAMASNNASAAAEVMDELSPTEQSYLLGMIGGDVADWAAQAVKEMAA